MGDLIPLGRMTVEEASMKVLEAFREHLSPGRPTSTLIAVPAFKAVEALVELVIITQGDSELYGLLDFVPLAKMTTELQKLGDQYIEISGLEQNILNLLEEGSGCPVQALVYQHQGSMSDVG